MPSVKSPAVFFFAMLAALTAAPPYDVAARSSSSRRKVSVFVDGKRLPGAQFATRDGTNFLSVRAWSDIFKAKVNYFQASHKVSLSLANNIMVFGIGSADVVMNGKHHKMSRPVFAERGEIYIPLEMVLTRAFSDILDARVWWDYESRSLRIQREPSVKPPKYFSYQDRTRLVFQMSKQIAAKVDKRSARRIGISFPGGDVDAARTRTLIGDGAVNGIMGRNHLRRAYVEIDLGPDALDCTMQNLSKPPRLVVDIMRKEQPAPSALTPAAASSKRLLPRLAPPTTAPAGADVTTDEEIPSGAPRLSPAPTVSGRPRKTSSARTIRTVVVDAGHGGRDPGAIGTNDIMEKELNLEMALRLRKILTTRGYKVIMTRETDEFLPLAERTDIANRNAADVFISMHCNASMDSDQKGFEIYFLSETATDAAAQAVANMENAVIALEEESMPEKSGAKKVLMGMALNELMNDSGELCGWVSGGISRRRVVPNRGVMQANFFVLRGSAMPSVLVESGYITNRKEGRLLRQSGAQEKLVQAVADGVDSFARGGRLETTQ